MTTRFLMGVAEAGVFPGCELWQSPPPPSFFPFVIVGWCHNKHLIVPGFYLIGMFYKRLEAQKRFSFFFNSASLAGAFGGLLASAIGKMDGLRNYSAWRWIFILEGILTCIFSAVAFFLVSDFPEDAKWLSANERAFVVSRLKADQGSSGLEAPIMWQGIVETFRDWKMIPGALMYFGPAVSAYGEFWGIFPILSNTYLLFRPNSCFVQRACLLHTFHHCHLRLRAHHRTAIFRNSMGRCHWVINDSRLPVWQTVQPVLFHPGRALSRHVGQSRPAGRPWPSSSTRCWARRPDSVYHGRHLHSANRNLLVHHEPQRASEPRRRHRMADFYWQSSRHGHAFCISSYGQAKLLSRLLSRFGRAVLGRGSRASVSSRVFDGKQATAGRSASYLNQKINKLRLSYLSHTIIITKQGPGQVSNQCISLTDN